MTNAYPLSYTPVALVGAGPGNPDLITLRAKTLIEQADIIIYDYLAKSVLDAFASDTAEKIYVGKKGFSRHITQDEINDLLCTCAKSNPHKHIVRLKGGDPFVFGRGGEEATSLAAHNIPFEIVPGITAGMAAPLYAGIPVTDRRYCHGVTFLTGHRHKEQKDEAYMRLLGVEDQTLCFYMGVHDLEDIVEDLLRAGRDKQTPCALIRCATLPEQQTLIATLETVVDRVHQNNFCAPAIIVVGNVVRLQQKITWLERRPLHDKNIVVTRAKHQAASLISQFEALGARTFAYPCITIEKRMLSSEEQHCLEQLEHYDWILFTSANGVSCFWDFLREHNLDARSLANCKLCAIGPATARELEKHGLIADCVPQQFVGEQVVETLDKTTQLAGAKILIPRAKQARNTIFEGLTQKGAQVDIVGLYETKMPSQTEKTQELIDALCKKKIDAICFTSPSCVHNFFSSLRDRIDANKLDELLEPVICFSIGPVTTEALQEYNGAHIVQAEVYTTDGLVQICRKTFA